MSTRAAPVGAAAVDSAALSATAPLVFVSHRNCRGLLHPEVSEAGVTVYWTIFKADYGASSGVADVD